MPIGKFEADFESFHREVQRADGALKTFNDNSGKVAGGFTQLSNTGGGAFTALHQSVASVDRILAQFGVNIGSQVGALKEVADVARTASTGLNMLGTASVVVTTALAAWKAGRFIADIFDMDKKVANLTATFMGWGDESETARYRVEQLSKASQISGRTITDMSEAARINAAEVKRMGAANKEAAEAAEKAWKAAKEESARSFAEIETLGNKLAGQDAVAKATNYIDALNDLNLRGLKPLRSSYEDIVKVTGEAIQALKEQGQTGTQVYRELQAALNQYTALLKPAMLEARHLTVEGLMEPVQIASDENVQAFRRMNDALNEFLAAQEEIGPEATQAAATVSTAYQSAGRDIQAAAQTAVTSWSQAMQAVNAGQGTMSGTVQAGGPWQASREQIQRSFDQGKYWGPVDQFGNPDYARILPQQITVNAQGAFLQDNASVSALASRVGEAVMAKIRAQGGKA